jgi:hypothetical protein
VAAAMKRIHNNSIQVTANARAPPRTAYSSSLGAERRSGLRGRRLSLVSARGGGISASATAATAAAAAAGAGAAEAAAPLAAAAAAAAGGGRGAGGRRRREEGPPGASHTSYECVGGGGGGAPSSAAAAAAAASSCSCLAARRRLGVRRRSRSGHPAREPDPSLVSLTRPPLSVSRDSLMTRRRKTRQSLGRARRPFSSGPMRRRTARGRWLPLIEPLNV